MTIDTTIRERVLQGKPVKEQLQLKAYWGLCDLSSYLERQGDGRFYQVNMMIHRLHELDLT